MDLTLTIRQLEVEKESIELAVAELKRLQQTVNGNGISMVANLGSRKSKRGRKSMGSEERLAVSERMKRYWASRREPGE
jgi:hypothetical protein